MENLRVSSYLNHVEIGDGTALLYNGATLCMDLVPVEYARRLAEGADLSFLAPEETEHLVKRGHLTPYSPQRELAEFRKTARTILAHRQKLDEAPKFVTLCFILTYDCNLSCTYCFQRTLPENVRALSMSGEFIDRFFTSYYPQLFPAAPQTVLISLFGGEPLLAKNREAIVRILDYARERPSFRVSVSTNAVNVAEMADLIGPEQGRITHVHVTLDGDRIFHDQKRIPRSGKPTFAVMIEAIRLLLAKNVQLSLRVHIHPERVDATQNLVAYLEKGNLLGPQVSLYFSPINLPGSDKVSLNASPIFPQLFQDTALKLGYPPSNLTFMKDFLMMQKEKLLPKVKYCSAGSNNFYLIDPLGDIYGCYEDAGHKERRIGAIENGKVEFYPLKEEYAGRHLLKLPECVRCSAALFCGGGCPSEARLQKGSMYKAYCHQNKEFIAQTLKAYFLLNQQAYNGLQEG